MGLLGVLLPPLLVFLEPLLFDGQPFPRGSLSATTTPAMRELFVGVLWAIGVFLFDYKFVDHSWESRLSPSPDPPPSSWRCSRPGDRATASGRPRCR